MKRPVLIISLQACCKYCKHVYSNLDLDCNNIWYCDLDHSQTSENFYCSDFEWDEYYLKLQVEYDDEVII